MREAFSCNALGRKNCAAGWHVGTRRAALRATPLRTLASSTLGSDQYEPRMSAFGGGRSQADFTVRTIIVVEVHL